MLKNIKNMTEKPKYTPSKKEVERTESMLTPEQSRESEARFATFGIELFNNAVIKELFPSGIPIIDKNEIKKKSTSSYHNRWVAGYLAEAGSDALFIQTPDKKHVYDPDYLVSDIWGNSFLKKDGKLVGHTQWVKDRVVEDAENELRYVYNYFEEDKRNTFLNEKSKKRIRKLEKILKERPEEVPVWNFNGYEEIMGEYVPKDMLDDLYEKVRLKDPINVNAWGWEKWRKELFEEYKKTKKTLK